jgi:protein-L-isoaspartate O-methyltransferase
MRALDVGSGSGYLTACMALMVGTAGRVVGIGKTFGFVPPSTDLFV